MSGVFNLGDVFELIDDGFDKRSFAQQALVRVSRLRTVRMATPSLAAIYSKESPLFAQSWTKIGPPIGHAPACSYGPLAAQGCGLGVVFGGRALLVSPCVLGTPPARPLRELV